MAASASSRTHQHTNINTIVINTSTHQHINTIANTSTHQHQHMAHQHINTVINTSTHQYNKSCIQLSLNMLGVATGAVEQQIEAPQTLLPVI
jgi:hypothetical protein